MAGNMLIIDQGPMSPIVPKMQHDMRGQDDKGSTVGAGY